MMQLKYEKSADSSVLFVQIKLVAFAAKYNACIYITHYLFSPVHSR